MVNYNIRQILKPIQDNIGRETFFYMRSRGIKLIGIRFYPYNEKDNMDERSVHCMQKSLYGSNRWFYFNKGFKIIEEQDDIQKIEVEGSAFDSSFLLYSPNGTPVISISAIVGQNGTGKSTIVDTVIRLLNNLSAAIIGENYVYASAQHLHYIDNVYASLAIYEDTYIKIITCKGRKLSMTKFLADKQELLSDYEASTDMVIEHYKKEEPIVILDGTSSAEDILEPQNGKRYLLQDLFYTLVSNYSLYAYNYRDYISEKTNGVRLERLREINPEDNQEEDEVWLKGVFHKNDGYQTPIVIHPMREDGYINASKVNYLGRQNLISLCFEKGSVILDDGTIDRDAFPFREINQTHHIVEFFFAGLRDDYSIDARFHERIREKLRQLKPVMIKFWENEIGVGQGIDLRERVAWDYLIYKTFKVMLTYSQYSTVKEKAFDGDDIDVFRQGLWELLDDASHRTQKIRRTVAFLRFCREHDYYMNKGVNVKLDYIYQWMESKKGTFLFPRSNKHNIKVEDLLPPPFENVVLRLIDNEHLEAYKNGKAENDIIPFSGLSSGERQIAYTLGNIVYHLKNIESNHDDINDNRDHVTTFKYSYVNIMLDEVELYFHPDLQRRFIHLLLISIANLQLRSCTGINITLVTHSPFVLSDIPSENILCLSRNPKEKFYDKTFAANIHDLFNNTFILPYTIGEFAKNEITELLKFYNYVCEKREKLVDNKDERENILQMLEHYKYLADIIGDGYIREEAKDMIEEISDWCCDNNVENEEN